RLDFQATGPDGNLIWNPQDIEKNFNLLLEATTDQARSDALGGIDFLTRQLVTSLLPPEGDFLAIIVDALGGDDRITVGPTVQKTVWVDAGAGDDQVQILSGYAILVDQAEQGTRNDSQAHAFTLTTPATIIGAVDAPANGRLSTS